MSDEEKIKEYDVELTIKQKLILWSAISTTILMIFAGYIGALVYLM